MAHIGIDIGEAHHLTLVHFETMTEEKYDKIFDILIRISAKVTKHPTGKFGKREVMGRYKNVQARLVHSPYIEFLRNAIVKDLDAAGITYSKGFDFTPHVSKPIDKWFDGGPVPFAEWMDLQWKDHTISTFEL